MAETFHLETIDLEKLEDKKFDEIVKYYDNTVINDDTSYKTLYYVMMEYYIVMIAFARDPMFLFDKIKIPEGTIKLSNKNDKRPHVWLSHTGCSMPDSKLDIDVVFPWDKRSKSFANQLSCKAMCSFFILAYIISEDNYDKEDVLIKCVKIIVCVYKDIKIKTSKTAIGEIPLLRSYEQMKKYENMISYIMSNSNKKN